MNPRAIALVLFCLGAAIKMRAQQEQYMVYFPYDKYEIPDSAMLQLVQAVYRLRPTLVLIEAHCDSIGSIAYNRKLSMQRAQAVKRLLTTNDVSPKAIRTCIGYGKEKPLNRNQNEQERQRNRRALVTFIYETPQTTKEVRATQTKNSIEKPRQHDAVISVDTSDIIVLENLIFFPGRHILKPESYPELQALFNTLDENPTLKVEIQGHVCCTTFEADGYDWDEGLHNLSVARAQQIYKLLISMGIEKDRLRYKGFGGSQKIHLDESTESTKAQNRRVEIKILER